MAIFDDTIPADTEGVNLGASRIRQVKSALNDLLGQLFDDSSDPLPNSISDAQLQSDTKDDSLRAVGADHLKSQSVSLRSLIARLFPANWIGRSFFQDQIFTTPQLSSDITLTVATAFTQPAVGSSVVVTTTEDPVAAELDSSSGSGAAITVTVLTNFTQPAISASVDIALTTNPISAGITVGQKIQTIDESSVNEYRVTAVTNSPNQISAVLLSVGGALVAGQTVLAGTVFTVVSRTVKIIDGSSFDVYNVTAASASPNHVTLTLVSVGGVVLNSNVAFTQPTVGNPVTVPSGGVTMVSDPVAAGIVVGMRAYFTDGSGVDLYTVTSVSSTTLKVGLTLVSIGGTNTAGTVIPTSRVFTFSYSAGATVAIGTPLFSPGAVLSADTAGRARMSDGFMTLPKIPAGIFTADTAGRGKFASNFLLPSMVDFSAGAVDGFVKAKCTVDVTAAASTTAATISASSVAVAVTSHGITAAVSLATVQPITFWEHSATVTDASNVGGTIVKTGKAYFARVIDVNSISVHPTAADALANTNAITFTVTTSGFSLWYVPIAAVGSSLNVVVLPRVVLNANKWQGYRFFWLTAFSSATSYAVAVSYAGINSNSFSNITASTVLNMSPIAQTALYLDVVVAGTSTASSVTASTVLQAGLGGISIAAL